MFIHTVASALTSAWPTRTLSVTAQLWNTRATSDEPQVQRHVTSTWDARALTAAIHLIVAMGLQVMADKFIVIVDESKLCDGLGPGFPLPVEITPFCHEHTLRLVADLPSVKVRACPV
jgi:hypothetical protein